MEKNYDVTLKGIVCEWNAEAENEVLVTIAVSSATMHNQHGATWNFPTPPLVPVTIKSASPFSEDERQALSTLGTFVELLVTGTKDLNCVGLASFAVREERRLEDFMEALLLVS
ncbi:MAG: hypothetical protein IJ770_03215 [Alphaproteobacteria bacterium]|nr:hypothetical protein [Alphaproteobacteria bacterium]